LVETATLSGILCFRSGTFPEGSGPSSRFLQMAVRSSADSSRSIRNRGPCTSQPCRSVTKAEAPVPGTCVTFRSRWLADPGRSPAALNPEPKPLTEETLVITGRTGVVMRPKSHPSFVLGNRHLV
jgi:hypothetical protein